jgi:hypothetical protein
MTMKSPGAFGVLNPMSAKRQAFQDFGIEPTWGERAIPQVNMYQPNNMPIVQPEGFFGTQDNMEITPQQLYEQQVSHPFYAGSARPEDQNGSMAGGLGQLRRKMMGLPDLGRPPTMADILKGSGT